MQISSHIKGVCYVTILFIIETIIAQTLLI